MSEIIGAIIFWCLSVVFSASSPFVLLVKRYYRVVTKSFTRQQKKVKKLYLALYTKDHLDSRHDWLMNQMCELRDKIDEFESYFPDECYEKVFLMKIRYKGYSEELYSTKKAIEDWEKRINEIVAALPKKYKGILEYNWVNAKVEVKEEGVCW